MNRYVSEALRRLVITCAENLCEHCLIDVEDTFFGGEVDHIVGVKHGGTTEADNLAYTCQPCNRNKGSDLESMYGPSGQLVRFFHPRLDHWADHFALHGALIEALTAIGEVTVRILGFNSEERLQERHGLIEQGRYPPPAALVRMNR
jgi:HNH endonuclease